MKTENPMRIDPLTGESFYPERSNQIFANRANQVKYNNDKANKERKEKSATQKPLNKNRLLIVKYMGSKKEFTKSIEFMRGAGYDFGHSTHCVEHGGIIVRCIYEFKIIFPDKQKVKFIRDE